MIVEDQRILTLPAETSSLSMEFRLAEGKFIAGAKTVASPYQSRWKSRAICNSACDGAP
jgi:hypothetical protein